MTGNEDGVVMSLCGEPEDERDLALLLVLLGVLVVEKPVQPVCWLCHNVQKAEPDQVGHVNEELSDAF